MIEAADDDQPTDRSAKAGVRDVLERFRNGWETQDADQVLSTIRRRDDTVIYGTDLAEHWVGFDALVEPFEAMVEAVESPVYTWSTGEPRIWVRNDIGWACGTLTMRLQDDGEVRNIAMRTTFVLENVEGQWKIAHAHFSVGQEEAVVPYYDQGPTS